MKTLRLLAAFTAISLGVAQVLDGVRAIRAVLDEDTAGAPEPLRGTAPAAHPGVDEHQAPDVDTELAELVDEGSPGGAS
jgi:hypothetical protein